jgi:hypothetical protein
MLLKKAPLKTLSRALPVLGAVSSGAYAAFDTYGVSKIAKAYFGSIQSGENSQISPDLPQ